MDWPNHRGMFGLTMPCTVRWVIDGDTVVVTPDGLAVQLHIRFISCWAPKLEDEVGLAAKLYVEEALKGGRVTVTIPWPEDASNPLKYLSFERIPGWLWLNEHETLNQRLCDEGLAEARRPEA